MSRIKCCLCDGILIECHKIYNFTNCLVPSDKCQQENELTDLIFGMCDVCGSVQLMTLIDPVKMYAENHNNTFFSNTWITHHQLFHEFITSEIKISNVIEVGGCSLQLYKLFDKDINYKILDFSTPNNPNVEFIQGNCETYDFDKDTPVILSHVFEHLYNPRVFVENCKSNDIFISVPQMEDSKVIEVHIEHTFYMEPCDLIRLFALNGYNYKMKSYLNHSYFFHFFKSDSTPEIPIIDKNRGQKVLESIKTREEIYSKINITENSYICPAGVYGYTLYHFLGKPKIKGFMDNDPNKIDKRMIGTNVKIFKFSQNDDIVFVPTLYTSEIKSG